MMYDSQSGGAGGQEDRETNADGERVGSRALSVFTRVLNARILRAHVAGPLSSKQLEQELGWAPKASLRVATVGLCEVGALLRSEPHGARQGTVTELTPAGADLLALADVLERWLANSPFGPIPLPDTAARGAVRALAAGWDAAIVGAVAERPRTLAELSAEISGHSYPGLKRRLAKLRAANLVTLVPDGKRSPMHAATQWLRCAVGPLSVAGRWELQHARASARPMTRREIEAKFLLALPLVELPEDTSGSCVLAALTSQGFQGEADPTLASVEVIAERGRVTSCIPGSAHSPTTWALGSSEAWLEAMIAGRGDSLRIRGANMDLAVALVKGIHDALFG